MAETKAKDQRDKPNPVPQVMRRAAFLSGRVIADAIPQSMRPRDLKRKPRAKPSGTPSHGGFRTRRKKLTGTVPLAIRKKMLAAKLRKAGFRRVTGMVNKRQEEARKWFIRKAKRDARRERERQALAA